MPPPVVSDSVVDGDLMYDKQTITTTFPDVHPPTDPWIFWRRSGGIMSLPPQGDFYFLCQASNGYEYKSVASLYGVKSEWLLSDKF